MAEYTPLHNDIEQPPSSSPTPPPPPMDVAGKSKTTRVASLDVFRGLCVFLMMVVDYGGSIFPAIAHAPWNGLHLADFVMPYFLFIAGLSLAIAYKKVGDRMDATKKATTRAVKLFVLGVFLQGGYLHGAKSLTYGVDILSIRWMGILQRISIAYLVAALCEIWLPCQKWRKFSIVRSYFWQWCVSLLLTSLYIGLLYGLYVPDWEVNVSNSNLALPAANGTQVYKVSICKFATPCSQKSFETKASVPCCFNFCQVNCGVRGNLSPACNSAGMIDRYIVGINHLYVKPAFKNLKICNKSKDGLVPEDSPSWCHAPFDPEGILG
ncbi:Heparan-alpha-glucosaminide N-acetyltransferase [Bienertia sinuspersici]